MIEAADRPQRLSLCCLALLLSGAGPPSPVLTRADPVLMTLTATGSLNSVPRYTCGRAGEGEQSGLAVELKK